MAIWVYIMAKGGTLTFSSWYLPYDLRPSSHSVLAPAPHWPLIGGRVPFEKWRAYDGWQPGLV